MRESAEGHDHVVTTIAKTGDRYCDFRPYVAAIDDAGRVAFQACPSSGGSAVFIGDGREELQVASLDARLDVISHPAIARDGSVSFYAERDGRGQGVFVVRDGQTERIATTGDGFSRIGPLGPTMNEHGAVAFRGDATSDTRGVFMATSDSVVRVADTRGQFAGFEGLPVVSGSGLVVFRADRRDGGQGIYAWDRGELALVVETGTRFSALGRFPMVNAGGAVSFAAELRAGGSGVFVAKDGQIETACDTSGPFESFRGALIDAADRMVWIATPRGGELGVYAGAWDSPKRILGIGDVHDGVAVAELALNPVSINSVGEIAMRIGFVDGAQAVVRVSGPG